MELGELSRLFGVPRLRQRIGNISIFQSVCARHDVNRVNKELCRDSRFFFIFAEAEQPQPWNHDDGGIGISQLRRVAGRPCIVVFFVSGSIPHNLGLDPVFQNNDILFGRIPGKKEGTNPRPQKMVWTTGAERTQLFRPLRPREIQGVFVVGIVCDHAAIRGDNSPQRGQYLDCDALAILRGVVLDSAERHPCLRTMLQNEVAHLVDGVNAVQVTIALRRSPGKQSVAAENQTFRSRIVFDRPLNHKR